MAIKLATTYDGDYNGDYDHDTVWEQADPKLRVSMQLDLTSSPQAPRPFSDTRKKNGRRTQSSHEEKRDPHT